MLVCHVSQLRRRAAIAADVAEAAAALDAPGTGNVVFATLVDDPASVGEHVDAFLGQIMREAASAAATVNANMAYAVAVLEAATASHTSSAFGTFTYSVSVTEPASATALTDALVTATYNVAILESLASSSQEDATGITPAVQGARALSASRAGIGSVIYSDDASAKVQVIAGVGVVTSAISTNVLTPTMMEAAASGSVFSAAIAGAPPPGSYQLASQNEFTSWLLTTGTTNYFVTVSGTWSGTMMLDVGIEGPPGTVTWYMSHPAYNIHTNGTYDLRASGWAWVRYRMALYVSGTAVLTLS